MQQLGWNIRAFYLDLSSHIGTSGGGCILRIVLGSILRVSVLRIGRKCHLTREATYHLILCCLRREYNVAVLGRLHGFLLNQFMCGLLHLIGVGFGGEV